jgi:phosphohistidine phosphatase SixA
MKRLAFFLCFSELLVPIVSAQSSIFIVRHAEKVDDTSKDPDLSEAGRTRAQALAGLLKDADITSIYVTDFKRTQQTAMPLAKLLGLQTKTIVASNPDALTKSLHELHGNALVVGHTNTIPNWIKALGIATPITIGDNHYDDLFVVVLTEKPRLIHLHYHSTRT